MYQCKILNPQDMSYDRGSIKKCSSTPGLSMKTLEVPYALMSTLNIAAEESGLSPLPPRPEHCAAKRRRTLHLSNDTLTSHSSTGEEDLLTPNSDAGDQEVFYPVQRNNEKTASQQVRQLSQNKHASEVSKPVPKSVISVPPQSEEDLEKKMLHSPTENWGFKSKPSECCCNRPKKTVWCIMCGFHMKGNVQFTCPIHSWKTFLYEVNVCPNTKCRAPKKLLKEIDLDF